VTAAPHTGTIGKTRSARVAHLTEPSSVAPPNAHATTTSNAPSATVAANARLSQAVTEKVVTKKRLAQG
jgi:hypothetical protein